ncbi:hypothetical protein C348_00585 [Cryptococcus neoformans Gb118]|nr:hypothetical protein C350_00585 [Cryptococcus neoformans var. grubii MW-RSA36]OXL11068.1 hypothetical protein C348_00585 [Cryptococcus neoformans var. grubii Gb118]
MTMSHAPPNKKNASGIIIDSTTAERIVPESRRADGSVRKSIKIRPGFTPQEDIGLFRSARRAARDPSYAAANPQIPLRSPKSGPPGSTKARQTFMTEPTIKDRASTDKDKVDVDEDLSQAFGKINLGKESERTLKNVDVEAKLGCSATTLAKEAISGRDRETPTRDQETPIRDRETPTTTTTVVDSTPSSPKRVSNPATT